VGEFVGVSGESVGFGVVFLHFGLAVFVELLVDF
jgi:hypothetical protein